MMGAMQDRKPRTRPRPIDSMGDLARTHGHRALRIAGVVIGVVVLLAVVGGTIRLFEGSTNQAVTPDNVDRLTPAWTADAGPGPIPGVATSADGLFVSSADGLLVYPVPCDPDTHRECASLWRGPIPDGPLSTPTTNGTAVFAGSAQGRVYAFPAGCDAAQCRPLWNGVAGNGPVSTPGVNDDFVYVTSGKLYAFPATCGTNDRTCPPAWVGEIPGRGAAGRPAVGAGLVVVTSATQEGGVAAFPAVCLDPCKPVWVGETGGRATSVTLSQDTGVRGGARPAPGVPTLVPVDLPPRMDRHHLAGPPGGSGRTRRPHGRRGAGLRRGRRRDPAGPSPQGAPSQRAHRPEPGRWDRYPCSRP